MTESSRRLTFPPRAIGARFVGLPADNQYINCTSAARTLMAFKQGGQTLELIAPTKSSIQSGLEMHIHKHTLKMSLPANSEVLDVIPIRATNSWRTMVFFKDVTTNELNHIELRKYYTGDGKHGFKYLETEDTQSCLRTGSFVAVETPLLEAPSSLYEDEYNYGIELNTLVASFPETAEDGIMVSRDAIERMAVHEIHSRKISIPYNHEPIDTIKHNDTMLVIPEPGMHIREDGIIMAVRSLTDYIGQMMSHTHYLSKINHETDTVHQLHGGGGEVVDIWVLKSGSQSHTLHNTQLDKLANICQEYHAAVLKSFRRLVHHTASISPETNSLITNLILTTEKAKLSRQALNLTANKINLAPYYIEIVIAKKTYPDISSKISDKFSAKSVFVKIEETENMPVDAYGRRADLVVSKEAGTNRNIVGRDHAMLVVDCIHTCTEMLLAMINRTTLVPSFMDAKRIIRRLDPSIRQEMLTTVQELYMLINKAQAAALDMHINNTEEIDLLLADAINRGLSLLLPLDVVAAGNNLDSDHAMPVGPLGITVPLLNSRFYRPATKINYVLFNGNQITTEHAMKISPVYYRLLDKLGQTFNVSYTSNRQVRNLTAMPSKRQKQLDVVSHAATKMVGNDEAIVLGAVLGKECTAKYIRDLADPTYNAVATVKAIQTGAAYPDISVTEVPVGQNPSLALIKHVFHALGVDLYYKPE